MIENHIAAVASRYRSKIYCETLLHAPHPTELMIVQRYATGVPLTYSAHSPFFNRSGMSASGAFRFFLGFSFSQSSSEVLTESGFLRNSVFFQVLGEVRWKPKAYLNSVLTSFPQDFIATSFQAARKADPDAV